MRKHLQILFAVTWSDFKKRYKGTVLGIVWTFLYPVLFLGVYSLIYLLIFKIQIQSMSQFDYILLIFSGLIPFIAFSDAFATGVVSIVDNRSLVKNTTFPPELITAKSVLMSIPAMVFSLSLVMVVHSYRYEPKWTFLFLPILIFMQVAMSIGIVRILASLNVFFRDISQSTSIVILFLMLVSPIAYTETMVPESYMLILYLNPLYYVISAYRYAIFNQYVAPQAILIYVALTISIFYLGRYLLKRLKPLFGEYL